MNRNDDRPKKEARPANQSGETDPETKPTRRGHRGGQKHKKKETTSVPEAATATKAGAPPGDDNRAPSGPSKPATVVAKAKKAPKVRAKSAGGEPSRETSVRCTSPWTVNRPQPIKAADKLTGPSKVPPARSQAQTGGKAVGAPAANKFAAGAQQAVSLVMKVRGAPSSWLEAAESLDAAAAQLRALALIEGAPQVVTATAANKAAPVAGDDEGKILEKRVGAALVPEPETRPDGECSSGLSLIAQIALGLGERAADQNPDVWLTRQRGHASRARQGFRGVRARPNNRGTLDRRVLADPPLRPARGTGPEAGRGKPRGASKAGRGALLGSALTGRPEDPGQAVKTEKDSASTPQT